MTKIWALRFSACCQPPFYRSLRRLPLYMHVSHHFVNEKGTEGEICPAVVSGIVTGNAPVSCWPIFSPFLVTVPKVFAKGDSAQFLPVANDRLLFFSSPLPIGITALHVIMYCLYFFYSSMFYVVVWNVITMQRAFYCRYWVKTILMWLNSWTIWLCCVRTKENMTRYV